MTQPATTSKPGPQLRKWIGVAVIFMLAAGSIWWGIRTAFPPPPPMPTDLDGIALAEHMSFGDYVDIRKSEGWSIGMRRLGKSGIPINGMFVYLFWAVEAGSFLLAGIVGASFATGKPFCETCGKWSGKAINVWSARNVAASNVAEMKTAEDLKSLFAAAAQKGMPTVTYNFNLATCPTCSVPGYLTVEKETLSQDKDGKEKIEKTDVISHILAEPQEVARIAATMKR